MTAKLAATRRTPFSLENLFRLARGRMPGQLVVQLTDRCNATCPQCEMRKTNRYARSTLDLTELKRILEAAARNRTQAVSFTGGEPFLYHRELLELGRFATSLGIPFIRTGTNGFMFLGHDKPGFEKRVHELAEGLVAAGFYTVWISLDSSVPEVHEQMRGLPGVVRGIEKALPIFHAHGLYPSANLGINRNIGGDYRQAWPDVPAEDFDADDFYERARASFSRFYNFAISLGFTIINMCYPMSVDGSLGGPVAVYTASSLDRIVRFRPDEKRQLFRALLDVLPTFRDRIRIFTPASAVLALIRQYDGTPGGTHSCRGGLDFFFVSAQDGETYPCGFRATDRLGKYGELDLHTPRSDPGCTACDWECFRDPSELLGPFLQITSKPLHLLSTLYRDALYRRLWLEDLRYYRACDYFSGRTPPRYPALARFRRSGNDSPPLPGLAHPSHHSECATERHELPAN